jgi:hypothetical protein
MAMDRACHVPTATRCNFEGFQSAYVGEVQTATRKLAGSVDVNVDVDVDGLFNAVRF